MRVCKGGEIWRSWGRRKKTRSRTAKINVQNLELFTMLKEDEEEGHRIMLQMKRKLWC